ncbi:MAG TPA: MotA/TolQ/ExbB proton channel family protein [Candidatus Angelobacter sp.]
MESSISTAWPFFIAGILALCAFASWRALQHIRRYKFTETRALEYIADKLKRAREVHSPANDSAPEQEAAAQTSETAETQKDTVIETTPVRLVSIEMLLEGFSRQTLIADRLELIKRMRESQVKVSLSALQQMTLAREASARWLSLPSYAASLAMMLGLLGTVVGLAIMVQQIDLGLPSDLSQVTMNSWVASIAHIRGVLDGMRTAFSATMAGIASAIILSWLNHRLAHAQSAFLDRLDRFTAEDLLPATVPGTEDDSLLEKVSLQLETSFGRLDEIAKNNQETLVELNAIEKGFVEIVGTIRDSNKAETSERIQSLIGRTSGIIEQVAELNKSIVAVAETLPGVVTQVERSNQNSLNRIDQLIRSRENTDQTAMGRIDRLIGAYEQQRSLVHWPLQVKVVFGFMAVANLVLLGYALFR